MKTLKNLSVIEKEELNIIHKDYIKFKRAHNTSNYLTISTLVTYGVCEIVVSENAYNLTNLNSIRTMILTILVALILSILVFYVFAHYKRKIIITKVKHLASKYNFDFNTIKNEFNLTVKSSLGGPGIY